MPIALQATPQKTLAARLRRAGLFLAITLSISGTFQLILHIEDSFTEAVVRLVPEWLEPAPQEEPGAVVPPTAGVRPADIPEQLWQASPRLAWTLGVKYGMAAEAASVSAASESTRRPVWDQLIASFQDDVHRISTDLNVPPPELPVIRQQVYAMREFSGSLEEQPTAKALAQRYTSRHAALFRLGALSGYRSIFVHITADPDLIFAREIRRYGMAAGLAEELWQPLAGPLSTRGKDTAVELDLRITRVSESLAPAGAGRQ